MTWAVVRTKCRNWMDSEHKIRKLFVSFHYYAFKERKWKDVIELSNKEKFTAIYEGNLWNNEESRSGGGSTLKKTRNIRTRLPQLVRERGIRSLLDAGCGDFHWMKEVELGATYIGGDIVREIIDRNGANYGDGTTSFVELDITRDEIPPVDMILCRECLFHLSYADIFNAIGRFKGSGAKYLLATHHPGQPENRDIVTGMCRALNLEAWPFNFPRPVEVIDENTLGECLALWELAEIAVASVRIGAGQVQGIVRHRSVS
jgi:SAM-dependent methyltransferase